MLCDSNGVWWIRICIRIIESRELVYPDRMELVGVKRISDIGSRNKQ